MGMKSRKKHSGLITTGMFFLAASLIACSGLQADTNIVEDTETSKIEADPVGETLEISQEPGDAADKLFCLKNGDTKSLVGLSPGDVLDYDNYEISGVSSEGQRYYREKGEEYGSIEYSFNGKGNGFSGLAQFADGDFLGIRVGEDTLETLTDILGNADILEEEKEGGWNVSCAVWNFREGILQARIRDGKISSLNYFVEGAAADARELRQEETDFGRERLETKGCVEAIYGWSAFGSESEGTYGIYEPCDEDYDAGRVGEFIREYLQAQGIEKEEPDGVTYWPEGDLFTEYYVDKEKGQYCFIVHFWNNYCVDQENNVSVYQDEVYCTTYTLEEEGRWGSLIREWDEEENRGEERLYDNYGKRMAEAVYEYMPGTPFPFVLESRNLDSNFHPSLLLRNQKTWFYKQFSAFDEAGRFLSYKGSGEENGKGEYLCYPCWTVHDETGRLKLIREELQQCDKEKWGWWDEVIDYSGQMEIFYDGEGNINSIEYLRSSYSHGTSDSNGRILYDDKGRMVYNGFYITHGGDAGIFLYEGDSRMPWCVLRWCSYLPGFEEAYLFLQQ
ncbi:MAG: hypothetical protein OSJ69_00880 [Acetatifactor sp.]|nr:hypothetical protein [Acetatifactor sp.]